MTPSSPWLICHFHGTLPANSKAALKLERVEGPRNLPELKDLGRAKRWMLRPLELRHQVDTLVNSVTLQHTVYLDRFLVGGVDQLAGAAHLSVVPRSMAVMSGLIGTIEVVLENRGDAEAEVWIQVAGAGRKVKRGGR